VERDSKLSETDSGITGSLGEFGRHDQAASMRVEELRSTNRVRHRFYLHHSFQAMPRYSTMGAHSKTMQLLDFLEKKSKLRHSDLHGNSGKTSAGPTQPSPRRRATGARINRDTLFFDISKLPGTAQNLELPHFQGKIHQRAPSSRQGNNLVHQLPMWRMMYGDWVY
jgi:hypothetical protein